jgi:hypothetical protein
MRHSLKKKTETRPPAAAAVAPPRRMSGARVIERLEEISRPPYRIQTNSQARAVRQAIAILQIWYRPCC